MIGEKELTFDSAVLAESSAFDARLTGSKKFGVNLTKRIEEVCSVLYDEEIIDSAFEVSAQYRASGLTTFC